jgi:hypothetical protein
MSTNVKIIKIDQEMKFVDANQEVKNRRLAFAKRRVGIMTDKTRLSFSQ